MRDGIIYDCPNANCRTPIDTGKCSKICIERYKKEIGIKPQTNADRIRAMSDEELADWLEGVDCCYWDTCAYQQECRFEKDTETVNYSEKYSCKEGRTKWLKQPAEDTE